MSDQEAKGYIEVVRRDSEPPDLGKTLDSDPPPIRDVGDHGCGTDLHSPAFRRIEDRLDLEEIPPGTIVATIRLDYDEWSAEIEYHVGPEVGGPTVLEDLRRRILGREVDLGPRTGTIREKRAI